MNADGGTLVKTPSPWVVWLLAARPKTLPAAVVPVAVGTSCAGALGQVRWPESIAALAGALLLQIGSNFANDVFDFEKGADTEQRVGPTRVVAAGWVKPQTMRAAMLIVFLLAAALGAYLTAAAGVAIVAIGVLSMLCAVAYTGGPYPLGYNGLGDLFVMIFFGFVAVCGTVFVNLGHVPKEALLLSIPPGALATAILVVNNVRDVETDAISGKRTLVVRLGRHAGLWEYRVLLASAYLANLALCLLQWFEALVLLPWATLPLAWKLERSLTHQNGPALNQTLAQTARLLLLFGVLLTLGLALSSSSFRAAS